MASDVVAVPCSALLPYRSGKKKKSLKQVKKATSSSSSSSARCLFTQGRGGGSQKGARIGEGFAHVKKQSSPL